MIPHLCRSSISAGASLEFQSTSTKGAALITQHEVRYKNAERRGLYAEYWRKHCSSIHKFLTSEGYDVSMDQLLLVTGCDVAQEYAMATFSNNTREVRAQFRAGIDGAASVGVSAWGSWSTSPAIEHTCGPFIFPSRTPSRVSYDNRCCSAPRTPVQARILEASAVW